MNLKVLFRFFAVFPLILCGSILSVAQTAEDHIVQLADEMYLFGDIKDALDVYKQALEINPQNVKANYMAGKCYLESIHKEKSLPYLLKAYELKPDVSPKILYMIGRAYHLGYNFDQAISYYNQYKNYVNSKGYKDPESKGKKAELHEAERRIFECKNAIQLVKDSLDNIVIENLGSKVNSQYPDYGPLVNADENVLFFTSRRSGGVGGNKDNDNEYFEDIYVSYKKNGKWEEPQNLGNTVNTALHESCIGLSPDGNTLYLYIDNDKFKGDIFKSTRTDNGTWSTPVPLNININSEYIENSISVTSDGKLLFFSSNKPGGIGGKDIYMSRVKKNGDWEVPVNLGYDINTEFDEEGPFIASDGKTLYFSSKGHKGMGGYDLFKSVYDSTKNKWSAPENVGYPINSTDDDIYFVLSASGKYGYYASVKKDSKGHLDLYRIRMPGYQDQEVEIFTEVREMTQAEKIKETVEETPEVSAVELLLEIYKSGTRELLDAKIEISSQSGQKVVWSGMAVNGKASADLTEFGKGEYLVSVEKDGYIFKNLKVSIPDPAAEKQVISRTVSLEMVAVGVKTILKNIYFDFNKATLKSESDPELKRLLSMLTSNPKLRMEIGGHTDAIGPADYNKSLSAARAEAVVKWLVAHGVDKSRLQSKGYGEEQPIASNDDEDEGRELNRRIEFIILE